MTLPVNEVSCFPLSRSEAAWRFGDCFRRCAAGVAAQAPLGPNTRHTTALTTRRFERRQTTPFGSLVSLPGLLMGNKRPVNCPPGCTHCTMHLNVNGRFHRDQGLIAREMSDKQMLVFVAASPGVPNPR